MDQRVGTAALVSIVAAIGSFIATAQGHGFWGLFAAVIAVPAGALGLLMASSPRVRGGLISMGGIALGVCGAVFAVLGLIF